MDKIIKLNKRHVNELTIIDFESEHKGDRERNISKNQMKKEIRFRFDKKQEKFFGYKKNNELVAYVTLKPFFPGHKHCEIYWLAVKKKYQGNKIGTRLINFIAKKAKNMKFRKIFVYTGKNMTLTRKFYQKNGFELINEFKEYYGFKTGNNTAVLYGKKL